MRTVRPATSPGDLDIGRHLFREYVASLDVDLGDTLPPTAAAPSH